MMFSRGLRWKTLLAGVLSGAFLLAACGGGEEAAPTPPPTPTTAAVPTRPPPTPTTAVVVPPTPTLAPRPATPTATSVPAGVVSPAGGWNQLRNPQDFKAAPKAGGIAKISFSANPPHFDTFQSPSFSVSAIMGSVYQKLVRCAHFNEMKSPNIFDCELVPELAESWSVSADGKEFTFKIRQGVKWQNLPPANGRALTADDVVFSLNEFKSAPLYGGRFGDVDKIEKVDANTVKLTLKAPNVSFLPGAIAANQTRIVPREIKDRDGDFRRTMVGTGPFMLDSWTSNVVAVYKKNPDYWRKDAQGRQLPYLDGYQMSIIFDVAAGVAAVRTGQLHYSDRTGVNVLDQVLANLNFDSKLVITAQDPDDGVFGLFVNSTKAPWTDIRVRQALSKAINQKQIIDFLTEGKGVLLPMYPWPFVFDKLPTLADWGPNWQHDPAGARALLSQAGVSLNVTLDWAFYGVQVRDWTQAVAAQLPDAGIRVSLNQATDLGSYSVQLARGLFKDMAIGFAQTETDVDGYLYRQMHSAFIGSSNFAQINSPELDQLLVAQRQTADPTRRRQLIRQVWELERDNVWRIPLPEPIRYTAHSPKIHNIVIHWRGSWPSFGSNQWEVIWIDP